MAFFVGKALIFNNIFRSKQGKLTFSRNSLGINRYSSWVDPQFMKVFRGECNFMEFFKGKRKR